MADRVKTVSQEARQASSAWFSRCEICPLGEGFINDTFRVQNQDRRYVLQRINGSVFPNPRLVMSQTSRVVDHITTKISGWVPALVPNLAGELLHEDAKGEVWRLWDYVEGTETHQSLRSAAALQSAAQSFARFQNLLIDLPGPRFEDPIPDFLQLERYLVEGLLRFEDLPDDWWEVDPSRGCVIGERSGRKIAVGDRVKVILNRVHLPTRQVGLALAKPLSGAKTAGGKRKRRVAKATRNPSQRRRKHVRSRVRHDPK